MMDSKKLVKNTLFNPSVTGSTFEDFSQNAVLLPAMEKPAAPVLNVTPEQILQSTVPVPASHQQHASAALLTPVEPQGSAPVYSQQEPQEINFQEPQTLQQSSGPNITSVLSSFSNYLRIGGGNNQQPYNQQAEAVAVPAPAGLDSFISQDITDAPPVPLFSPSAPIKEQSQVSGPPPTTGPVNTFRRTGLKRPAYAQIPGLTSNTNPQPLSTQSNSPSYFAPPQPVSTSIFQPPLPQSSISPASSTSSIQDATFALNSQFKPINPQPPSFPSLKPINIPQPQHSNNLLQLGPVMDAIPASEILPLQTEAPSESGANQSLPANNVQPNKVYRPVYHHWFHRTGTEDKSIWTPFSMVDSLALEHAFISNDLDPDKVIATDGGRYDVNILRRQRTPVYWKGAVSEVRRCSWFYKNNTDRRYTPYEENVATRLEEEFKIAFELNQWNRKVHLANGETVEFHGSDVLMLFPPAQVTDAWTNTPSQVRPRVVKRGMDEFDIDEGEPAQVDHLLLMVHGIGAVCDLKFRTIEEVVDEFRSIALQLTQSHYKSSCEQGITNRIEVLPISWHTKLHSEETGVDEQLKKITLDSIPRLRQLTNDTIMDVLFYTSPIYSQTIISIVGDELNRVYNLFKQRNPSFTGGVSIGGHSLGSLILFDLLAHQQSEDTTNDDDNVTEELFNGNVTPPNKRKICRRISYMMGAVGASQSHISYPVLNFKPSTLFALGSPIGMFITVRGLKTLGENFSLPTCPAFFNIFHPYDPVAYRLEALINPELSKLKPALIPHHKGRKRMHLELKETMARVGADLKQKVFDSMKSTWNSFYQLAIFHKSDQPSLEAEADQNLKTQMHTSPEEDEQLDPEPVQEETNIPLGQLNKGRRIDYVLQEAPLEFFNDYIFTLSSHTCYWGSEDTILMFLKEIYSTMDIHTDSKIPQQTMTIERLPPSPKDQQQAAAVRIDPCYPINTIVNLPPPPTSGFVKKT